MRPISLPIALRIEGEIVILVGEGDGAKAKSRLLQARGAIIRYLGSDPDLVEQFGSCNLPQPFAGARACFVATEDSLAIDRALQDAQQAGVLINVMDRPELCQFTVPAIVDRGPVQVSIATDGVSPVLARLLRGRVEQWLPQGFEKLVGVTARLQAQVRARFSDLSQRRRFWEQLLSSSLAERAMRGEDIDQQVLDQLEAPVAQAGEAYLVGAGPGDAELMTLKGLRLLQQADVVLYDALVSPEVIDLARRDAVLEDVGKRRGRCANSQDFITDRILFWAKQGKRVCRLKGGDPYLFGRGGEEARALAEHEIPFEVVPGITSAAGVGAQAGIPMTHHGVARSVRYMTGHVTRTLTPADWAGLVDGQETLVLYMALHHLSEIEAKMLEAGVPGNTPVALVQNGSRANQEIWKTPLAGCGQLGATIDPARGPTLVIVGHVVSLADTLASTSLADRTSQSWLQSS